MAIELACVVLAALIFVVMVLVQGAFSNLEHGPKRLLGNRDALDDQSQRVQRAKRANQNMIEAMVMFVPLALVAVAAGATNSMTAFGAVLFVVARLAYAPLYWFGPGPARSLAWTAGLIGIVLVALALLSTLVGI